MLVVDPRAVEVVVPAGVVLVGVVPVGVVLVAVEVVAGAVVVLGTEMDVGPSDAGKPTLPAVLRRCFGSFTVDCGS